MSWSFCFQNEGFSFNCAHNIYEKYTECLPIVLPAIATTSSQPTCGDGKVGKRSDKQDKTWKDNMSFFAAEMQARDWLPQLDFARSVISRMVLVVAPKSGNHRLAVGWLSSVARCISVCLNFTIQYTKRVHIFEMACQYAQKWHEDKFISRLHLSSGLDLIGSASLELRLVCLRCLVEREGKKW